MAKAAGSNQLRKAFEAHYKQTEGQVKRLEKVFAEIDTKVQGKTCPAIIGIIDEGKEILEDYDESPALDAGLLASAQAVEHYEICRYGTLVTWASDLGYDGAVELLKENLAEEEETDELLNELARAPSTPRPCKKLLNRARWICLRSPLIDNPPKAACQQTPGSADRRSFFTACRQLQTSHQNQYQQHDNHEPKTATAVIARAVEWASADAAESTQKRYYQNDENDRCYAHGPASLNQFSESLRWQFAVRLPKNLLLHCCSRSAPNEKEHQRSAKAAELILLSASLVSLASVAFSSSRVC